MAIDHEIINAFPEIEDGITESNLSGVRFFKMGQPVPKSPIVYNPGLCILLQGYKIGYLGDRQFRYDANQYLVTSVTIPFEVEIFVSEEEPLLGFFIDIDMGQLNDLIGRIGLQTDFGNKRARTLPKGIGPASMDAAMQDAVKRLVQCLHSEVEAQILGPGLVREILYRALLGSQAPVLYSLAMHSGTFSQVARALNIMQSDYAEEHDVEHLAKIAHMSTTAFHRAFKEITSDSPMQYLKKIRLNKARDLMIQKNLKAYMAAHEVGYESPSQFSREFKRYFGHTPVEITRQYAGA